jgi:hypothetical protein
VISIKSAVSSAFFILYLFIAHVLIKTSIKNKNKGTVMKKFSKIRLFALASIVAAASPMAVLAATDSDNTVINANLGSTISLTTSGTVTLNVTPVSGGSQTSASDSLSVSTNNTSGYNLTLANNDTTTSLQSGANTIGAHAGTHASPTALANNSWGYAIPGGNFDASYSALTNVTSSSTKWAGVPSSSSPNTLKTTASTASGDSTTVWYSVKADTTKPNGTYTDTVTYTATTNP